MDEDGSESMEKLPEDILALGREASDPITTVKMSLLFFPKKLSHLTFFFSILLPPEVWKKTEGTGLGQC